MLRVGLTGELGSGKSTVARLLAGRGAHVLSSDEIGRELMEPGQPVYEAIVAAFGPTVTSVDGRLDRPALARLAFGGTNPRIDELNAIVHPAVIAEQERRLQQLASRSPDAIVVIESALLFTTRYSGTPESWHRRFDFLVLVTAPEAAKLERFIQRAAPGETPSPARLQALREEAIARLAQQRIPPDAPSDFRLENAGDLPTLEANVEVLWDALRRRQRQGSHTQ